MATYLKSIIITTVIGNILPITSAMAQNNVAIPVGVYAPMYASGTTLTSGGTVLVGTGGNWFMAGNITSADKGDSASPTTVGRSEIITFSGSGTYSNAVTTAGTKGNIISGYAGVSGVTSAFLLPIGGADSVAYPFTTPANSSLSVAYFAGTGNSGNQTVATVGNPVTVYIPFLDFNVSSPVSGNSIISWPAMVATSQGSDYLLSHPGAIAGNNSISTFVIAYQFVSSVYTGATNSASAALQLQSGFNRIAFGSSSATVLPITLLSFTGVKSTGGNLLNWKVSDAVNFSHFDLQRHTDGGNFATITSVPYNTSNNFSYLDAGAVGTNYYRLNMVDIDGSIHYSNTVIITGNASNFMVNSIYPNPAKNVINVATYSPVVTNAIYNITDLTGRKVLMERHAVNQITTQTFNISMLAAGTYLLSVDVDGVVSAGKFVKQ